jgi:hypothetical protein
VNKLTAFSHLDHLNLKELWLNWNLIADTEQNRDYLRVFKVMEVLYLADNPVANVDDYERMIRERIPGLRQLDGNQLRIGQKFYHQQTEGIHPVSAMKQLNPKA